MTFADLAVGSSVFVDSNVLIYHFAPDPALGPACSQLIDRIRKQELSGFTATPMVTEMAHRLMTIEAMQTHGYPAQGIVRRLKRHPQDVQGLSGFRRAVEEIPQLGIQVLTVTPHLLAAGAGLSQQIGLLTSDALLIAVMREHGLSNLASHDADFDRVPGVVRYGPM
jgi:predicted nucleic acid-binding protein